MENINNKKQKLPSLSFVIATYNSSKTLAESFDSIEIQDYPKDLIEIIVADGGSTDKTLNIAKKHGAKILSIKSKNQGAEYNRASGAHVAKNEILVFIDHDNILPHRSWLKKMILPFIEDNKVIGVETLRYDYDKKDTFLGRYFSLFGVNDVLPFYFGKADRLSYMYEKPQYYGAFKNAKVSEYKEYYVVDFSPAYIPTLGSNGFMIRKQILFKNAQTNPNKFFHIDVNVDLIKKGFCRYAFIKDTIIHKTQERGLWDYLKRRKLFVEKYHVKNSNRRYSVYEDKDFSRLIYFIFISSTVVKPFFDSLKGFFRVRDFAWFLHPVLCYLILISYSYSIIRVKISKYV